MIHSRSADGVDVSSPDRSVRILATAGGGLTVKADPGRHTDETFARQIAHATRLALKALQSTQAASS